MKSPAPGKPPQYAGAMDVVRKVIRTQGARGLYAGIQAPLPFVAVFNATLFASNGLMRKIIGRGRSEDELSIAEIGLAGLGAGVAVSFVACPTELVKCRLQAQPGVFAGAIDCTRQVVASKGMSGLFLGFRPTIIREMGGNCFYFMGYTGTLRIIQKYNGSKDLHAGHFMVAGGVAGLVFWAPVYPVDVIKTLIQTDSPTKPRYKGIMDCMRQTVKEGGGKAVFKGIGPAVARSFPANAVTFLAYEWTRAKLNG